MRLAKDEKRCAVYTRKSTDERLDTEFNSLDAQYDACASYIRARSGWAGGSSRKSTTTAAIQAVR